MTSDILKSKQDTINFLEKIKGTQTPVLIDEYECVHDLVGLREIKGPPTHGLFVVISQIPIKFDFEIHVYEFPVPTYEDLKRIAPRASEDVIKESHGDIRFVLQSLNVRSDAHDVFKNTNEYVADLVSKNSKVNPMTYLDSSLSEPGNTISILHENYTDVPRANLEYLASVSEYFSDATVFETKIYDGNWELFPYYMCVGCILPALEINHRLSSNLRPGSSWTKFQNMCMREKRIQALCSRKYEDKLSFEALYVVRKYIENNEFEILKDYKVQVQDIDVFNYLNPYRKIKPKEISTVKKWLTASESQI